MTIKSVQWTDTFRRSARVIYSDGVVAIVPADPANADYATLLGAGTPIADYVAPPAPVPAISPFQASLWLAQHGKSDADVTAVIGAIPDMTARLSALAYWNKASTLQVDNPLIATLWAGLGLKIPAEQAFREAARLSA